MTEHAIKVRHLRGRFGDAESNRAECSCGWIGGHHTGRTAESAARRDGRRHLHDQRPLRLDHPEIEVAAQFRHALRSIPRRAGIRDIQLPYACELVVW